jgi:hypothetical protein
MEEDMKMIIRLLFVGLVLLVSSTGSMAQWVHMNIDSVFVTSFATIGDMQFVGTSVFTGVYRSTNRGGTWVQIGLSGKSIQALTTAPDTSGNLLLFAGTYSYGVFVSHDSGSTWTSAGSGQTEPDVYAFTTSPAENGGANLFAATAWGAGYGVHLSTNNGGNWTNVTDGLTTSCNSSTCWVDALAYIGNTLFAGTMTKGVFRSTDNGTSWTASNTGLTTLYIQTFATSGTDIFVGTWGDSGGVFRSTNNGATWTDISVGLTNSHVQALVAIGTNLFVGTEGSGIFLSTNNGASWTQANEGLTDSSIWSLTVSGSHLFAGSDRSGVWRRPLSEMITDVGDARAKRPTRLSLRQNYPNPFNPTTTLSFDLPFRSFVSLKIFNLLGQEISTLVSRELAPGTYEQEWNSGNLASGVYILRLQADSFTATKKLILLR